MAITLGIDLGTTNSVAAVATPLGVEFVLGAKGERVHPSVVAFPAQGGMVVGQEAKLQRLAGSGHVVSSAKRLIGQNMRSPAVQAALEGLPYQVVEGRNQQPIVVSRGRQLTVPEISAQVLMHLKRCAERQLATEVEAAVITVPANFTDGQRQATKEAGRLAGLEVTRLINEPTAAALAYGFGQGLTQTVCVFDYGGGTFDVSVLRVRDDVYEVVASSGDVFLGGDDLDRHLAAWLATEFERQHGVSPLGDRALMARLTMAAERIKCHLSDNVAAGGRLADLPLGDRTVTLDFDLTRGRFEGLIRGELDRCISVCHKALAGAGLAPGAIDEVICVGGSTRIPAVQARIQALFGRAPNTRINPDEVVAHGAAIQAGTLSGQLHGGTGMAERAAVPTAALSPLMLAPTSTAMVTIARAPASPVLVLPRPLLIDVNPASLGLQTVSGYAELILEKDAPIPIERTRPFTTTHDDQTRVVIDCCRGESRRYADNEGLGTLTLDALAARPRGDVVIDVTFRVDVDGILHVSAVDRASGLSCASSLNVLGAPLALAAGDDPAASSDPS